MNHWHRRLAWSILPVLIVASISCWYARHLPRYTKENDALARIESLLDSPVRHARLSGFAPPGLEFVSDVYLPACTVGDDRVSSLIECMDDLPRLSRVDIRHTEFTPEGLRRMKAAFPRVSFGWVEVDASRIRRSAGSSKDVDREREAEEIGRIEKQLQDGVLPEPPMWTLIHVASEEELAEALEAFCSEKPKDEHTSLDLADIVRKAGGLAEYRQRIAGLLKSKDATVRGFAAVWLADMGDKAYAKDILALLESDDLPDDDEFNRSWDRGQAAFALGVLGASEHSETLAKFLTHDDQFLRSGAAAGLARLGAKDYEREIAVLLRDNDREVVLAAIWALARLDAKQYRDEIAGLARSHDVDIAETASAALETFGETPRDRDRTAQSPRLSTSHCRRWRGKSVVDKPRESDRCVA